MSVPAFGARRRRPAGRDVKAEASAWVAKEALGHSDGEKEQIFDVKVRLEIYTQELSFAISLRVLPCCVVT